MARHVAPSPARPLPPSLPEASKTAPASLRQELIQRPFCRSFAFAFTPLGACPSLLGSRFARLSPLFDTVSQQFSTLSTPSTALLTSR